MYRARLDGVQPVAAKMLNEGVTDQKVVDALLNEVASHELCGLASACALQHLHLLIAMSAAKSGASVPVPLRLYCRMHLCACT